MEPNSGCDAPLEVGSACETTLEEASRWGATTAGGEAGTGPLTLEFEQLTVFSGGKTGGGGFIGFSVSLVIGGAVTGGGGFPGFSVFTADITGIELEVLELDCFPDMPPTVVAELTFGEALTKTGGVGATGFFLWRVAGLGLP